VRGQHHGGARPGERAQCPHQLRAARRVEAGGRLVEEEQGRLGEQLRRDRGPLALAAGQFADRDERTADQLKGPQHHVDRRAGHAAQRRGVAERAGERQREVNDVVLGDVADAP